MKRLGLLILFVVVALVTGCAKSPCRPVVISNNLPDLVKVRKMENGTASHIEMPKAMFINKQGLELFQYEILNRCAQTDGLNVVFEINEDDCTVIIK